jgi:hypothetical protein
MSNYIFQLTDLIGDFNAGTVIIDKPGKYMLAENITFCPIVRNSSLPNYPMDAFQPVFPSLKYDEHAFALGFSSAIAIVGENIELHLNGKTMKQCEGHLLIQRFFAHIALALTPFTASEGPHNFVNPRIGFKPAKNVLISGPGRLGRSSHHGKTYTLLFQDELNVIVVKTKANNFNSVFDLFYKRYLW